MENYYEGFWGREKANAEKMLRLLDELRGAEFQDRNSLTINPILIEKIRRTAHELAKVASEIEPMYKELEKVRQFKRKFLAERIERKEVEVVGVWIHEAPTDQRIACTRCIGRLKNPDGTPFSLEQAAEGDLILDTDNTEVSKELKEKGCGLCGLNPTPRDEVDDGTKNNSPYCHVCHRPVVYI